MTTEQQKIRLRIPTARSKLQTSFPQDPRGDIKIIVGKKVFKLQKAFLRLQSSYFKRKFLPEVSLLNVEEDFQQSYFENVLRCFYGITIEIKRTQVLHYYPIIKFLQIQCLLKYLKEDMIKNISAYDLFLLMRLAHQYNQQDIFQACLNELEKQNFQQLQYSRFQLLKCSQQLFKLIIKTHNRYKTDSNKGLSYTQIDQIIKQFCEEKGFGQSLYHEMKFELIDKTSLSALEYKEIFLDNVKKSFMASNSFVKSQSNNFIFTGGLSSMVKPNNLTQSMISPTNIKPQQMVSNQLTLQMQNTFEKKLNQELKSENQMLKKQLQNLRVISDENQKNNEELKKMLNGLQEMIKLKQDEDKKHKDLMNRMQKTINILKTSLDEKTDLIRKLEDKVTKLEKNSSKKYVVDSDEEQQEHTIQSQIVPAHLIGQMLPGQMLPAKQEEPMTVFKKKPPPTIEVQQKMPPEPTSEEEQLDDEDLQEMYTPRLAFVEEPLGTPKKYLPVLADLITQAGWNKKKLTPIFRRSIQHQSLGKSSDIKGRNELLFLIKTQYGQYIGGYITVSLPKNTSGQYIEDRGAFLFSLSKKQKFMVEEDQTTCAIFLNDESLIEFGHDLKIPLECTKQKSESKWPSSYSASPQTSRVDWFLGGSSPFLIRQIQVYEVQQAEMQMVL